MVRKWLVVIRKKAGLTQKDVAEASGISPPAYYNIEKDLRNPSVRTTKRISKALGFEWQRFYEDEGNGPAERASGPAP